MPTRLKDVATVVVVVLAGVAGRVSAETPTDTRRGELLYSTHCIACHSTELHWRDKKAAKNWVSLKAEVERWQKTAGLAWREGEVTDVARYLNALYYRFPEPRAAGAVAAASVDAARPR